MCIINIFFKKLTCVFSPLLMFFCPGDLSGGLWWSLVVTNPKVTPGGLANWQKLAQLSWLLSCFPSYRISTL